MDQVEGGVGQTGVGAELGDGGVGEVVLVRLAGANLGLHVEQAEDGDRERDEDGGVEGGDDLADGQRQGA